MPSTLRQKQWYLENQERERYKRRVHAANYRKSNPEHRMLAGARDRAKVRSLDFNIDISDIHIPNICPILKQPMVVGTRYAPSLDRKDPALGYVKNNVWVISRKANVMKNDATTEELQEFAAWLKTLKI